MESKHYSMLYRKVGLVDDILLEDGDDYLKQACWLRTHLTDDQDSAGTINLAKMVDYANLVEPNEHTREALESFRERPPHDDFQLYYKGDHIKPRHRLLDMPVYAKPWLDQLQEGKY